MPVDHIVSQGEHTFGIARDYGFSDYHKIWDHPNNADLKSKRKNPNTLFPGDHLYIPDLQTGEYSGSTDQQHSFRARNSKLKLRLTLEDQYEKPIASAACLLVIETESHHLTTDGAGKIELEIPPSAHNATLVIQDAQQTPYAGLTIPIKIGDLDPLEEVSGQRARLNNLGYVCAETGSADSAEFRSAVEEFQCEQELQVDGICGTNTQARLKQVHGC